MYRASLFSTIFWWRWGESNPCPKNFNKPNSYAIATWMTILNCLSGRATNREQRTIDQAPPSFRHGSTETLDGSGIILHRAYSVNLLNLTRLPAERCAVLASVYLLGSDRRSVTSIISYLCVARKMEPYPRWKCFCSLSKPLHPHDKHVIDSTCTAFCDGVNPSAPPPTFVESWNPETISQWKI